MEISPRKRYNIFPMSAVFRVWPVLVRVLWIAAAIALAAPVALAEIDDSRPVSAGEFNREVGRMDKKLDNLSDDMKELTRNMTELSQNVAVLTVQVAALAKAVDEQRREIGGVREELSALYRMIVGGAIALAVGLLGVVGVLLTLIYRHPPNSPKSAANANVSASTESQPAATFVLPLAERPKGRPAGRRNSSFPMIIKALQLLLVRIRFALPIAAFAVAYMAGGMVTDTLEWIQPARKFWQIRARPSKEGRGGRGHRITPAACRNGRRRRAKQSQRRICLRREG